MSTFANPAALPTRQPRRSGGGAIQLAPSKVGETANDLLSVMKDWDNADDTAQVAEARNAYLMLKTEQDRMYDDDEEFDTIPERYTTTMNEGLSAAAGIIQDPRLRDQFILQYEVDKEQGVTRIQGIAGQKAKDKELSEIQSESDILREQGLGEGADMGHIVQAMEARWSSAADRNVVDHTTAQAQSKEFAISMATGKIKMLQPEQQLEALSQEWAGNIPTDTQALIRKEANDRLMYSKGQKSAFKALDRKIDAVTFRKELEAKGTKAEQIRFALAEFNGGKTREKQVASEAAHEIWNQLDLMMSDPATAVTSADIIAVTWSDRWGKLTVPMRNNLRSHMEEESSGAGAPKISDYGTLVELYRLRSAVTMAQDGPDSQERYAQWELFMHENSASLNKADRTKWLERLYEEPDTQLVTFDRLLESSTRNIMNDQVRGRIFAAAQDWYATELDLRQGKPISAKEITDSVNLITLKQATDADALFFTGDQYISEMEPGEKLEAVMTRSEAKDRRKIIDSMPTIEERVSLGVKALERYNPKGLAILKKQIAKYDRSGEPLSDTEIYHIMSRYGWL